MTMFLAMKLLDSFRSSGDAHCDHDELTRLLDTIKHIAQAHDQSAVLYNERKLKQQDLNKTLANQYKQLEQHLSTQTEIIEDESLISDEGKYLLTKAEHYSVDNLKLVNIEKTSAPLGATIRNKDGNIVISRIVMGGAAHQSGLLHEDDQILEINNLPVRAKTINDICHLLANLTGIISFLIIPNMSYEPLELDECPAKPLKLKDNTLHVRALFSYVPGEDLYLPCKELGLAFNKGDILHVINDDDAQWWQAYKQGDEQSLAGLVPSQQFQQKRNEQIECIVGDSFMDRKKRGFCYRKHMKSPRRKFMALADEQLTYEEMVLYKCERKRPIILIGPHSIGRHELRKRLMQTYPSMFEVAVPHTTRPPRKEEINGKDYHFLPKHIFEVDIKQARFIEHGEFEKNLYGTSYESIRKVIQNDKVCVLNLYPQALKALKCSDLIPYVVYIGPPSLARLREIKSSMNESLKDSDLVEIIDKGREIEELYAHYFDKTIRMCDMNETFEQLYQTICQVQNEPTWVPLSWIEKN
ncbi:MAGUK p55 subfamily member 5-like isoform X3 [Brachionus plicatilis]|uniref:MAGUK p55 subfamily member 5-like isoform X3 n=1 Tax=Brachionus plicatilis TaxID=10195 RepID=A0A3M7QDL1_BRAPC|nr:MAGUK p55 subfamily member 5-like isoform X3 [Brachionus plicatilis]